MPSHIIPRKIKVKMEFFKGITIGDILIALVCAGISVAIFTANFAFNIWVGLAFLGASASMFIPIADGVRLYVTLLYLFRFFAQKTNYLKTEMVTQREEKQNFTGKKKKANNKDVGIGAIVPFEGIVNDRFIDFKEYYAQVIEVQPIEFGLLNEYKQELVMDTFANAMRRLSDTQSMNIIKLPKAVIYDSYINEEDKKYELLLEAQYAGEIKPEEVDARSPVFSGRVSFVEALNRQSRVFKDFFYLVVYGKDKEALETTVEGMISTLQTAVTAVNSRKLSGADLVVFMRANYGKDFDERELELIPMSQYANWAMPDRIKFKAASVTINKQQYRQFVISDYPLHVGNAWAYRLFALPNTRVNMKIKPIPRHIAERKIDKAVMELEAKEGGRSSAKIERATHLDTLKGLLAGIKNANQQMFDINTFFMCEEDMKKETRAILKQEGFKYSEMFGRQVDCFISSSLSMRDNVKETQRGIPTNSLAACFPFISGALQDIGGFYIGDNEYPVFVDFFQRSLARVNSNMIIIGKSGGGKSYAAKTLMANFAADNTKIFILDPEDEYATMVKNLHGKMIDVGSSKMGILNPFHIMTTLEADDGEGDDSYAVHLQFLEQFFRVVLEGMDTDSFEALNSLVAETYERKGISRKSEISKLKPTDFPIFDDLFEIIEEKLNSETNEFYKRIYMTLHTYIRKFATGGRNSNLWNGPTSISTRENFVIFSFRSLLANKNTMIASAQMLLIFKYLDNEIIKNRDYNLKYNPAEKGGTLKTDRKIIIAVDEAHVFINPKFPVALDFMANMAKRIRKYSGMQIVITQNIKDFVGTPEIQRQSTAVINASQYSMIFGLAPADITDLVDLYSKAGEINKEEQNAIVTAGVGQCFMISSAMNRTGVRIRAIDAVKNVFSNKD